MRAAGGRGLDLYPLSGPKDEELLATGRNRAQQGAKQMFLTPTARYAKGSPSEEDSMKIKVLIHKEDEGGFWGEVPALPGCFSQGDTVAQLLVNLREAIECHLDRALPADAEKLEVQEVEV